MSNPEDVMKIEEGFSSDDFAQTDSNPAKKPRLTISDTSPTGSSGQEFTNHIISCSNCKNRHSTGNISPWIPTKLTLQAMRKVRLN